MLKRSHILYALTFYCIISCLCACNSNASQNDFNSNLFTFNHDAATRWSSPENRNGIKGDGGKENGTAKGHPFDAIKPGESYTLLQTDGPGMINRIWITINNRSPQMLRSLRLDMYWDGSAKPAVSVPFGDFFGVGLGKTTVFANALFANPEGRSFVSFIQMPFKKSAKIVLTNESHEELSHCYYDVDYSLVNNWNGDWLYFHAYWHRDTATKPANDFELLPEVEGRGRYLGVNIGINGNPLYKGSWFGEGEVKVYMDGDKDYPTLNGTGTEDYISDGWGQSKFITNYSGCTVASDSMLEWSFYRFHIPDPVYFKDNCKVVLQQIGGTSTEMVINYQKQNLPVIPVATDTGKMVLLYNDKKTVMLDTAMKKGGTNFYRSDDVSATAYYYLDKPEDNMQPLQAVEIRVTKLKP
jgi:hypothetical protein